MTERQEDEVVQGEMEGHNTKGAEDTRGGWRLYELLGLTLEDEERVVDEIVGKTLNSMEDNTGGKEYLEKILQLIAPLSGDVLPLNEAITVLMFFGRQVGHVEYQAKQRRQKGGLAEILAAMGQRGGKAIIVGPDGPRVVDASELENMVKGGEE
jgi:hypothetical protein